MTSFILAFVLSSAEVKNTSVITPNSIVQCSQICPIGNSGQPKEPIGK